MNPAISEHKLMKVVQPNLELGNLFSTVLTAAQYIYTTAQLVKANKMRCSSLANRVADIALMLVELKKLPDNVNFNSALVDFEKLLEECKKFIESFTGEQDENFLKKYLGNFFTAGDNKAEFEGLNSKLESSVTSLGLSINVQQLFNREQDKKDYAEDRFNLMVFMAEISTKMTQLLDSQ